MVHVPPQIKGQSCHRTMFLEAKLADRLYAAMSGRSSHDKRLAGLLQDVDNFVSGQFISFGDHPFEKKKIAFMARTDPVEMGIFDVRSLAPSPAMRLFGAFTEADTFVGLTIRTRAELGSKDERHFSEALVEAQFVWNSLFPDDKPFFSFNPAEHVSQNVYIV
ncbi:hypothetical protein [Cypionkella sp. TWP1-2-1b2]|uniref:hypothetical protein n=1 Tax=Cypionkella sp. TWP1-2-1b2 TaxID=2804675 RepID=UPI003CF7A49C